MYSELARLTMVLAVQLLVDSGGLQEIGSEEKTTHRKIH